MQAITLLHALENNLSDLTLKYRFAYNPVGPDHSLPSTRINLNHCWHLNRFCQRCVRSTDFFCFKMSIQNSSVETDFYPCPSVFGSTDFSIYSRNKKRYLFHQIIRVCLCIIRRNQEIIACIHDMDGLVIVAILRLYWSPKRKYKKASAWSAAMFIAA